MNNEDKFWASVATMTMAPAWHIETPPGAQQATYDLYVYVVDASTGWMTAGAINWQDMLDIRQSGSTPDVDTLQCAAADMILIAGKEQTTYESPQAQASLTIAIAAMAMSPTFKAITPGGVGGHWLYIAYKLADHTSTASCVFFRQPTPGLVPAQSLERLIKQVIEQDTSNPHSPVGQFIAERGGAILAPEYMPPNNPFEREK